MIGMEEVNVNKQKTIGCKLQILLLMILAFFQGCSSLQTENCPYLITEQYISYDNESSFFEYAGAFFTIHNKSNKTIKKITLCFSLFDEEGNVVSLGNGQFTTSLEGMIEPGENKQLIINLDNAVGNGDENGYRIDFVYVSSITYEDSSVWQDYFGLYSL